jgi:hypothetical protein
MLAILASCGGTRVTPAEGDGAPGAVAPVVAQSAAQQVAPSAAAAVRPVVAEPDRVVAVGDLHGDLDNALGVLRMARVVDAGGHWNGGATILVQTGDLMDRGDDSRALLDLFRRLGSEAATAGGTLVDLAGNHEVMNLQGVSRNVSRADLSAFGGLEARAKLFSSDGLYGAWIRSLEVVHEVGSSVFTHGGITPEMARLGLDGMNRAFRAEVDAGGDGPVIGPAGPLWYRGWLEKAAPDCDLLRRGVLVPLGVRRMVLGHTRQETGRIGAWCDGALLAIDVGIADYAGSHPAALEIRRGDAWALYPTGAVDLPDPPG